MSEMLCKLRSSTHHDSKLVVQNSNGMLEGATIHKHASVRKRQEQGGFLRTIPKSDQAYLSLVFEAEWLIKSEIGNDFHSVWRDDEKEGSIGCKKSEPSSSLIAHVHESVDLLLQIRSLTFEGICCPSTSALA